MKKRILICSHWMEIGGAEKALLGLLEGIDPLKYTIDLFLCRHSGELMKYIPKYVNLLPEDKAAASIAVPIRKVIRNKEYGIIVGRCVAKLVSLIYNKTHKISNSIVGIENSNRFTSIFVKKIGKGITYDVVISFLEPHYIAAKRANGEVKIAWMHTDYTAVGTDIKSNFRIWDCFDYIIAVSEKCAESFMLVHPALCHKLRTVENQLPLSLIIRQAQEFSVEAEMPSNGEIRLLSVGRFCAAKNFDNVPDLCRRIRGRGLNIKWYLIGYGGDEPLIRRRIAEAGMEDYVVILGKKENPYPYIRSCDLYVQPSRYEGNCVCVREAQLLGKPVVITRYPTSASQLEDGVDGVIVPMENEGCAAGIVKLLRDPEKMAQLSACCKQRDYSRRKEMEKLYRLMED